MFQHIYACLFVALVRCIVQCIPLELVHLVDVELCESSKKVAFERRSSRRGRACVLAAAMTQVPRCRQATLDGGATDHRTDSGGAEVKYAGGHYRTLATDGFHSLREGRGRKQCWR